MGHSILDLVRGSDRRPRGDPDGGGPVGIWSHLAHHLRILHCFGRQLKGRFILEIRQWRVPLGDSIIDLGQPFCHAGLGDIVCKVDQGS